MTYSLCTVIINVISDRPVQNNERDCSLYILHHICLNSKTFQWEWRDIGLKSPKINRNRWRVKSEWFKQKNINLYTYLNFISIILYYGVLYSDFTYHWLGIVFNKKTSYLRSLLMSSLWIDSIILRIKSNAVNSIYYTVILSSALL